MVRTRGQHRLDKSTTAKPAAPAVYRPTPDAVQPKPAAPVRLAYAGGAPPVYRPDREPRRVQQEAAFRPVAIQPKLKIGKNTYTSREDLAKRESYEFFADEDAYLYFNVSEPVWKKRGFPKSKGKEARIAWMKERLADLDEMLKDAKEYELLQKQTVRELVFDYRTEKDKTAKQQLAAQQMNEGKTEVTHPETGKYKTPGLESIVNELVDSKAVFPLKEIRDVATKADTGGQGYWFELEIAVRALRSAKSKGKTVKVQLGRLDKSTIEMYLEGEIAKYDQSALKQGPIGADVVIWTLGADEQWSGKFIQAKSVKLENVKGNVEAAMSQLEGKCADPSKSHSASQREQSLLGPSHRGKIAVEVWGWGGSDTIKKAAESALTSKYVHSVSFRDPLTPEYKERYPKK